LVRQQPLPIYLPHPSMKPANLQLLDTMPLHNNIVTASSQKKKLKKEFRKIVTNRLQPANMYSYPPQRPQYVEHPKEQKFLFLFLFPFLSVFVSSCQRKRHTHTDMSKPNGRSNTQNYRMQHEKKKTTLRTAIQAKKKQKTKDIKHSLFNRKERTKRKENKNPSPCA
jgi:hypothetical protein